MKQFCSVCNEFVRHWCARCGLCRKHCICASAEDFYIREPVRVRMVAIVPGAFWGAVQEIDD